MKKTILTVVAFCLVLPAWSASCVSSVVVTSGGDYTGSISPTVVFTGGGGSGAAATAYMSSLGGGEYKVSSVSVTLPGSYTGTPAVSFTLGGGAVAHAVMSPCASFGFIQPQIISKLHLGDTHYEEISLDVATCSDHPACPDTDQPAYTNQLAVIYRQRRTDAVLPYRVHRAGNSRIHSSYACKHYWCDI